MDEQEPTDDVIEAEAWVEQEGTPPAPIPSRTASVALAGAVATPSAMAAPKQENAKAGQFCKETDAGKAKRASNGAKAKCVTGSGFVAIVVLSSWLVAPCRMTNWYFDGFPSSFQRVQSMVSAGVCTSTGVASVLGTMIDNDQPSASCGQSAGGACRHSGNSSSWVMTRTKGYLLTSTPWA